MPACRAARVSSISARSAAAGVPTTMLKAASPTQPASTAPQSMLSRSPARRTVRSGMPCTTTSLTDVQIEPGNGLDAKCGRYPRNAGTAPAPWITWVATVSSSSSVTPTSATPRTASNAWATTRPASRKAAMSARDLSSITSPRRSRAREVGEGQLRPGAVRPDLLGHAQRRPRQRLLVHAVVRRGVGLHGGDGTLQQRDGAGVVAALGVAAAHRNLRDALPEAAVGRVDLFVLPDVLQELMGLEEALLVEQLHRLAEGFADGGHDVPGLLLVGHLVDRSFWKGVTQVAVGCCHAQRGNDAGAVTLLERAVASMQPYPSPYHGVDKEALSRAALRVAEEIRAHGAGPELAFPDFPRT